VGADRGQLRDLVEGEPEPGQPPDDPQHGDRSRVVLADRQFGHGGLGVAGGVALQLGRLGLGVLLPDSVHPPNIPSASPQEALDCACGLYLKRAA
jgi:hypothetical protein